jgi:hypothetical protein
MTDTEAEIRGILLIKLKRYYTAARAWDVRYSEDFGEMQHKRLLSIINVFAGI